MWHLSSLLWHTVACCFCTAILQIGAAIGLFTTVALLRMHGCMPVAAPPTLPLTGCHLSRHSVFLLFQVSAPTCMGVHVADVC